MAWNVGYGPGQNHSGSNFPLPLPSSQLIPEGTQLRRLCIGPSRCSCHGLKCRIRTRTKSFRIHLPAHSPYRYLTADSNRNPVKTTLHWSLTLQLSWLERKMAATLFAEPPSSSLDEAMDHFLSGIGPSLGVNMFIAIFTVRTSFKKNSNDLLYRDRVHPFKRTSRQEMMKDYFF
jgi:hypothetical protein